MKAPTLESYIRHAAKYGGVAVVWETASAHLPAEMLPQLTAELKAIAKRRREPFRIPRSAKSPDPAKSVDSSQASQAISRNESGSPTSSLTGQNVTDTRLCEWCSRPLPFSVRADTRYCIGGRCKQKAYRARQDA
jgi:hypothetical protein